jgi:hypothetical protein
MQIGKAGAKKSIRGPEEAISRLLDCGWDPGKMHRTAVKKA